MKRCGNKVIPMIALACGVLFGAIFPAGFLVFLLCILILALGAYLFLC